MSDLLNSLNINENNFDENSELNIRESLSLNEINEMNILTHKGIVILHRHKKSVNNFDNKFKILRTESYGMSKIIFGKFN